MNKKKIVASVVASVSAVAIVLTGSFAWFTTQQTKLNNLGTKNPTGTLTLVEDFDEQEGSDLQPGLAVDKKVSVVQTGDSAAVARVRLEEFLQMFEADGNEVKTYKATKDDASDLAAPSNGTYVAKTMTDAALLAKLEAEGFVAAGSANVAAALTANVVTTGTGLYAVTGDIASIGVTIDPSVTIAPASLYCLYDTYVIGATTYKTYKFLAWNDLGADGFQVVDVTVNATNAAKVDNLEYEFMNQLDYVGAVNKESALATDPSDVDAGSKLNFIFGAKVKPITDWAADKAANTTDNWYYDTDGWAYWGEKILPGVSTDLFLSQILLDATATNAYAGIDWKVNVRMQGVQADTAAIAGTWATGAIDVSDLNATFQGLIPAAEKNNTMTAAAVAMMADVVA